MDPAEDHPLPVFLRIEGGNGQQEVRTVLIDGEPWFVAKDVCEVLGLKDHRTSVNLLDEDERHTVPVMDGVKNGTHNMSTLGRNQHLSGPAQGTPLFSYPCGQAADDRPASPGRMERERADCYPIVGSSGHNGCALPPPAILWAATRAGFSARVRP